MLSRCFGGSPGRSPSLQPPPVLLSEPQSSASQTRAGLQAGRSSDPPDVSKFCEIFPKHSQILYNMPGCLLAKQPNVDSSPPLQSSEADAVGLNSLLAGYSKYWNSQIFWDEIVKYCQMEFSNILGSLYFDARKKSCSSHCNSELYGGGLWWSRCCYSWRNLSQLSTKTPQKARFAKCCQADKFSSLLKALCLFNCCICLFVCLCICLSVSCCNACS